MASSLSNLPTEILDQILGFLSNNKQTLANLSLCSRRLNAIAEPILWSSYARSSPTHTLGIIAANVSYVSKLLTSPRHASHVRSIDLTDVYDAEIDRYGHPDMEPLRGEGSHESPLRTAIHAIDNTINSKETAFWLYRICRGDVSALFSLLLPALPNLTSLSMRLSAECTTPPDDEKTRFIFRSWGRVLPLAHQWPGTLTHLSLTPHSNIAIHSGSDSDDLLPLPIILTYLKSINTLTHFTATGLFWACDFEENEPTVPPDPRSTNITHLTLKTTFLSADAGLLALCTASGPGLTHLEYEHYAFPYAELGLRSASLLPEDVIAEWTPSEISRAILACRDTLESLSLGFAEREGEAYGYMVVDRMGQAWEMKHGFEDLSRVVRECGRLRSVDVRVVSVYGAGGRGFLVEALPEGVERVRLSGFEGELRALSGWSGEACGPDGSGEAWEERMVEVLAVEELIRCKKNGGFPRLKRVEISYRRAWVQVVGEGETSMARSQVRPKEDWLKKECEEVGVEFSVDFGCEKIEDEVVLTPARPQPPQHIVPLEPYLQTCH